ncbi:MAG: phosphoribosylamine--glycine ligase, partial [Verrucomicrobiota bacterium]|nr:phosphoribosylamine--glycine ligase [Verrucomicrobiota bacterium]
MSDSSLLNILVVGSGGREHALLQACLQSPLAGKVIAAPGNGGMALEAECFDVQFEEIEGMVALAQAQGIGLVIVGPELPLSLGLVDALAAVDIPAYGPNAAGAQLESNKAFCKDFFTKHNIPTAAYGNFTEVEPAL